MNERKKVIYDLEKFDKAKSLYPNLNKTEFAKMVVQKVVDGEFDDIKAPSKQNGDINLPIDLVNQFKQKTERLGFNKVKSCFDLVLEDVYKNNRKLSMKTKYQKQCDDLINQIELIEMDDNDEELEKIVDDIVVLLNGYINKMIDDDESEVFEQMIDKYLNKTFDLATYKLLAGLPIEDNVRIDERYAEFRQRCVESLKGILGVDNDADYFMEDSIVAFFEPFAFEYDLNGRKTRAIERKQAYLEYTKVGHILNKINEKD